jgi:hypothetical protein
MEISKSLLVDLVRATGTQDQAARAETLLPDPVDPDRDAQVLEQVGLDRARLQSHLSPEARSSERVGVPDDVVPAGGAEVHPDAGERGSAPAHG